MFTAVMAAAQPCFAQSFQEVVRLNTDPLDPVGPLLKATDGNLYGVSINGGPYNKGTIFRISASGTFTVMFAFNGPNGSHPNGGLIQASDGFIYGTTFAGGGDLRPGDEGGGGTVFRMNAAGAVSTVYVFGLTPSLEGIGPETGVTQGPDGLLYGSVKTGPLGPRAFKVNPTTGTFQWVHDFHDEGCTDHVSAFVLNADGLLYGTSYQCFQYGGGIAFSMDANGNVNVLHAFVTNSANVFEGRPLGALTPGPDGNLYGVSDRGLYRLDLLGHITLLQYFLPGDVRFLLGNSLSLGFDGFLYGTTTQFFNNFNGTVFRLDTTGTFTTIYALDGVVGGGDHTGVVLADDGKLYGAGVSTVFRLSTTGTAELLHAFVPNKNGLNLSGPLLLASDGAFYGTAQAGGVDGSGTVFRVDASGQVTLIHAFVQTPGFEPVDYSPNGGLVEGLDGALYGTTRGGGDYDLGTIFRVTKSGQFQTLYSFDGSIGQNPTPLMQARDGSFFGLASVAVFRIGLDGSVSSVDLDADVGSFEHAGALVQGPVGDDSLYATADFAVFRFDASGHVTVLRDYSDGSELPYGTLTFGSDGALYGVSTDCCSNSTIFKIDVQGQFTIVGALTSGVDPCAGDIPNTPLFLMPDGRVFGTTSSSSVCYTSVFAVGLDGAVTIAHMFEDQTLGDADGSLTRGSDGLFYGTTAGGLVYRIDLSQVGLAPPVTPQITSALAANATIGYPFSYQITATENPSAFGMAGQPSGLSVNAATGLISGTPTTTGTFDIILSATQGANTGTAHLTLVVLAPIVTAIGSNVTVTPTVAPGTPAVSIDFSSVTQAGATAVTTVDPETLPPSQALPSGFSLGDTPVFYEIQTTAGFTGPVTVCFSYAGITFNGFPRLLHFDTSLGTWIDITSSVDTAHATICGLTSSFSPFAIATSALNGAGFYQPINPVGGSVNAVKGGSTVPLKFNVYGAGGVEITNPAAISGLTFGVASTACVTGSQEQQVTFTTTGNTALRYDTAARQFVQNWKTPTTPGCYLVRLSGNGLLLSARFKIK